MIKASQTALQKAHGASSNLSHDVNARRLALAPREHQLPINPPPHPPAELGALSLFLQDKR